MKNQLLPSGLNERTSYKYDTLGRQTEVTVATGTDIATTTYSIYDNASRVIKFPNGIGTDHRFCNA